MNNEMQKIFLAINLSYINYFYNSTILFSDL